MGKTQKISTATFSRIAFLAIAIFVANFFTSVPAFADAAKDFKELQVLAMKKNAKADVMFRLAECFDKGTGTPVDKSRALAWYSNAASAGHEESIKKVHEITLSKSKGLPPAIERKTAFSKKQTIDMLDYLLSCRQNVGLQKPAKKVDLKKVADFIRKGADPAFAVKQKELKESYTSVDLNALDIALVLEDYKLADICIANGADFNLKWRSPIKK